MHRSYTQNASYTPLSSKSRPDCICVLLVDSTLFSFQGSEAKTIVYGISNSGFETRTHVYTAVTRARSRVVIVGRWQDLVAAVEREHPERQTALDEKIRFMLETLNRKAEEADVFGDSEEDEEFTMLATQALEDLAIQSPNKGQSPQRDSPKRHLSPDVRKPSEDKIRKLEL